jgi:hypothetical protein
MRGKGICYDTGFINKGNYSRKAFDPDVVRRELRIIREDLHCNAVRITGGDPERLEVAATLAAEAGLEVWFSPFTCDLSTDEMLTLLADCAERAERIRRRGSDVIFVTGAELSLMTKGFLPGDTIGERVKLLKTPERLREVVAGLPHRVNDFLSAAVACVRERFGGKVTYAAIPFEGVDWTPFDVISVDFYRSAELADRFATAVGTLVARGKPVAITEFGSTAYRGAADKGARGGFVIEWDEDTATPLRLDGEYIRDEAEQAQYVRELLQVFDAAGVDTTLVFTFAGYDLPHRADPRHDLDMASYGVVKILEGRRGDTYPDMEWEPKAAFIAVADYYRGT